MNITATTTADDFFADTPDDTPELLAGYQAASVLYWSPAERRKRLDIRDRAMAMAAENSASWELTWQEDMARWLALASREDKATV
jgi:hypothetical protein